MGQDLLLELRKTCGIVAYMRDDGSCMYCLHIRGRGKQRAGETDHVFGHGNEYDMRNEHWVLRLTLCPECHYQKHHGKDGRFDNRRELLALVIANLEPQMSNWKAREMEALVALDKPQLLRALDDLRQPSVSFLAGALEWLGTNLREKLGTS